MKTFFRRAMTGVLVAAMSASVVAPMSASAAVEKIESVYVKADASGAVETITVSDQLKGAGELTGTLKDKSSLTDIKNVKGDETFDQSGEDITWNLAGEDIYYQGKTTAELPVSVKFTYELDGKEVDPQDIVGKSGKLKIHIEYENKESSNKTVNGESAKIYTPFVMATGMILDNDIFSNIKIEDGQGKVIDSGSSNIVVTVGLPGLKESLDLDEDNDDSDLAEKINDKLGEKFTISAEVKDFEMKNTFTFASPNLLSGEDIDDDDIDLSEIDDKLDDMEEAVDKLSDGAKSLSEGGDKLDDGLKELSKGIKKYTNEGVSQLTKGIHTMAGSSGDLKKGVNQYVSGVDGLAEGTKAYVGGADQIAAGVDQLNKGLSAISADQMTQLTEGLKSFSKGISAAVNKDDMTKLSAGAKAVSDGIGTVNSGLSDLEASYDKEDEAISGLETTLAANEQVLAGLKAAKEAGAQGLDTAIATLEQTTAGEKKAIEGLKAIESGQKSGIDKLKTATSSSGDLGKGASSVSDGVGQLATGLTALSSDENVQKLSAGLSQLSSKLPALLEGVKQLKAGSDKLTANDKKLIAGADALLKASKTMKSSIKKLSAGVDQLDTGATQIDKATSDLNKGVDKLDGAGSKISKGALKLSKGFDKFRKKAIDKLIDMYDSDIKTIVDRMDAISDAGDSYNNFSGSAIKDGEVKFIIETEAVKADD